MVFSAEGRKLSHTFHRILMRSAAKLAYQQAQAAIDGRVDEKTDVLLEGVLKPLWAAYEVLKRGRDAREPLELDLPERKILLTPEGTVDKVIVPERLDAHKLIEEFMIQANVAAAETLERHKVPLLYRIHDMPSEEKVAALKEFLSTLDIKLGQRGGLKPSMFNGILRAVADSPKAGLVNEVVLRSQAQAEYNPFNIGHFGLHLRRYAHFTSPIRRYADLVVHRGLIRALKFGGDGLPETWDDKLEAIGAEISACERRAMMAGARHDRPADRALADGPDRRELPRQDLRRHQVGPLRPARRHRADGFVPAATIGDDYYVYDQVTHAMIGQRSGETFRLGDTVDVKLVEAQPFAGALRFEMLSEGTYDKVLGRKRLAAVARDKGRVRGAPSRGRKGPPRR